MKYKRIILIVTDSLGIGGDKRAKDFGDEGANTFFHISETSLLEIPTLKKLGIDSIAKLTGYNKALNQIAYTARVNEKSNAKDTLAGHWEMMGVETTKPYPTFTDTGFPDDLIKELEKAFGKKIIGNKSASGIKILDELAQKSLDEDSIIVYTSTDSVLQICGHETKQGLDNLYKWCEEARKILSSKPEWNVGRIIARPYIGSNGKWERTSNRHDYALDPTGETILDRLVAKGIKVTGVGKIRDIFNGNGISESIHSDGDANGMDITIDWVNDERNEGFLFVNLVDFDTKFGHRRNPEGYAKNINMFDIKMAKLLNALKKNDLLIWTSDHGNDPTFPGSDHTREHVPFVIYSKNFKEKPKTLGTLQGFATMGNLVAKNFDVELSGIGEDIFERIK